MPEAGPLVVGGREIDVDDRFTTAVAVRARSFVRLNFEHLQDVRRLIGGSHDAHFAAGPR